MKIVTDNHWPTHPQLAIRVLRWSPREEELIGRTIELLAQARERIGTESDAGMDLGKAEAVLRDHREGVVLVS